MAVGNAHGNTENFAENAYFKASSHIQISSFRSLAFEWSFHSAYGFTETVLKW